MSEREQEGGGRGGGGIFRSPPAPLSLAFLPDSHSLRRSFALTPSLQCFPNPRWWLINTRWNILCSLAQNTPDLQATLLNTD